MDSESDISFTYEDDDEVYLSQNEETDLNFSDSHDPSRYNSSANSDFQADSQLNLDLERSPNILSSFWYRSLRMESFIDEHFVTKAKRLHETILPNFSLGELLVMLQYKKWLVDEVTSEYYDNWPKLRDGAGLTDTRGEVHEITEKTDFSCGICCLQGDLNTFLLSCDHRYCAECYSRYIEANIALGSLIRCMDLKCNLTLLPEDIDRLLSWYDAQAEPELLEEDNLGLDGDSFSDYTEDLADTEYDQQFDDFNFSSPYSTKLKHDPLLQSKALINTARVSIDTLHFKYRWCPAVDCNNLAELVQDPRPQTYDRNLDSDLANVPIVKCPSSHEFCFDCSYENHLPCPCWLAKMWIQKCEDDSETANWIEANTQSCPVCFTQIEKNGGCNHLTCRKCSYEFCWICLTSWENHKLNYVCNHFDPDTVDDIRKKRSDKQQSLNKYLHYYKRFSVHQKSIRGDEMTLANVHRCMLAYMKAQRQSTEKSVSWNDVQYLSDAIRCLSRGRKTLMWTYAFAFYLKRTNLSQIFEGVQDYLSQTVEDLSLLFETINKNSKRTNIVKLITLTKTEIVNLANLVNQRQRMLIECAHSELQLGSLEFIL